MFGRKSDILKTILHKNNIPCNDNYVENHNLSSSIQNNSLIVNMENTIGRAKHSFAFNYQFRNFEELLSSQSYDDLPRMVQRDICNPKQDWVLTHRRISELTALRHEVLVFLMMSVFDMCDDKDTNGDTD